MGTKAPPAAGFSTQAAASANGSLQIYRTESERAASNAGAVMAFSAMCRERNLYLAQAVLRAGEDGCAC